MLSEVKYETERAENSGESQVIWVPKVQGVSRNSQAKGQSKCLCGFRMDIFRVIAKLPITLFFS